MNILLCPDKFKGSLTAMEACEAMERGVRRVFPEANVRSVPIADGGEGTAEAIRVARNGESVRAAAHDALGREIEASYAWLPAEKTAIIEMNSASGMWRIAAEERDPLRANTFGTGELIADAIARGAQKILVGLGGSATNDAGAGMAAALGWRFLTSDGDPMAPEPRNFLALCRIEDPMRDLPEVVALCDVTNPLLGSRGASRVYGPQKGAPPAIVEELEMNLEHLADLVRDELGMDHRFVPGVGAAGGLGFGLVTFCNATMRSGFETVAEIIGLNEAVDWADQVLTGEGSLDDQTLDGKGPAGVGALARRKGKLVWAFGGRLIPSEGLAECFDRVVAVSPVDVPSEEALKNAAVFLEQAVGAAFLSDRK